MGFLADIQRFNAKVETKVDAVFDGVVDEAFRSIVYGSEITGAPGQPVSPDPVPEAGKLRDSWKKERVSPTEAVISTDVDYAEKVELNIRGAQFHSGGPHGLALTEAGFPRIVEVVAERVASDG